MNINLLNLLDVSNHLHDADRAYDFCERMLCRVLYKVFEILFFILKRRGEHPYTISSLVGVTGLYAPRKNIKDRNSKEKLTYIGIFD